MEEQDTQPGGASLEPLSAPVPPPLPADEDEPSPGHDESLGLPLRRGDTAALLLLALLADVCLYRRWGGTGVATLLVGTLIALVVLKGRQVAAHPYKVGLAVLALAAVLIWSTWWLAVVLAFVSIFLLAVHLWRPDWSLLESLWAMLCSIIHAPVRLLGHVVAHRDASRETGRRELPAKVIVIPAVVSVLFLIIFAAANPVVARQFASLWNHITDILSRLTDYLNMGRFLFWCGWLLVFAALIRPVVQSAIIDRIMKLDIRLEPCEVTPRIEVDFLVACVTLVCVNLVFLGYNCMDAVYLYFRVALPTGITWTAYTHAGCGWLTFGLFLSTVVLGFIFWHELNFHTRSSLLKRLAYVWIVQNAVLAVGTLRRISMYIDFSGLTHLLLTGVYGSLLVMAGLVIMVLKVRGNHSAVWLLRRYVAAFATGLTALALTPHGWVCATYNVPRILAEKPHAMWPVCLKELRADALPPIIPLLDYRRRDGDAAKEKLVREGIAAILGQHLVRLEQEETNPWSQWQASSWWALKHLRDAREKIYATVPPERWAEARNRLKLDYDLSGSP